LTEKVILNLTDYDSLLNHVTAKTTDEKVFSLTESDALSSQHDILGTTEHIVMSLALVESNFLWEMTFPSSYLCNAMSTHDTVYCKQFAAIDYPSDEVGLVICITSAGMVYLLLPLGNFLSGKLCGKCTKMQCMQHHNYAIQGV
jgi:hypothetical protein